MDYTTNPYAAAVDETAVWLEIYQQALESLPADLFTAWLIGVGIYGTDQERADKGVTLLPLLQMEYQRRVALAKQKATVTKRNQS